MIKHINGKMVNVPHGVLAKEHLNLTLELEVMESSHGFYLGTSDDGGPVSRESIEYWSYEEQAKSALESGEWNQKGEP